MTAKPYHKTTHNDKQAYVLGIDLGGSGPKIALVSDKGEVIASTDEKITTIFLPGGGVEQDPNDWWQKAISGSKKVLKAADVPAADIVAVACDSQWCLALPVDANGRHITNAIHWLDTRGGPYNRKIAAGFPSFMGYNLRKLHKWIRLAGWAPSQAGSDSLGHVLFIKNERADIYRKTYKFLEPMDYLTMRLTGKITATQKTMVPFCLVDNRRWGQTGYHEELLALAGVSPDKFPELIPNDAVVGKLLPEVAAELGLNPATQVVAGISDSNASLIGAGALEDFETIIYMGTSLCLTCHLPFKKTDIVHTMTSLPSPFVDRYYLLGEQSVGGRCIDLFIKNILDSSGGANAGEILTDAYENFNRIASKVPAGSGGVMFLPWLNGTIVPQENPLARGGFVNMALGHTRNHLARAVMESLAFNNRWTIRPAEKFMGKKISQVRFAGGGALSDLWAQIHADVLRIPVHQVADPLNTTVIGTAMLAFYTLGHLNPAEIASRMAIKHVFYPNEDNREIYDRMYRGYRSFYNQNKSVFRTLNG